MIVPERDLVGIRKSIVLTGSMDTIQLPRCTSSILQVVAGVIFGPSAIGDPSGDAVDVFCPAKMLVACLVLIPPISRFTATAAYRQPRQHKKTPEKRKFL